MSMVASHLPVLLDAYQAQQRARDNRSNSCVRRLRQREADKVLGRMNQGLVKREAN